MKLDCSSQEIFETLNERKKIHPVYDNSGKGKSFGRFGTLSSKLNFGKFTSSIGVKPLDISFLPTSSPCNSIKYNGLTLPINLANIANGSHRINLLNGNIKFHILEHVLSLSSALGINFNISVRGANSWPSLNDGINCFSSEVNNAGKVLFENTKYYTVAKPIKISFKNKIGSYIILLPDEGDNTLIFDMMVDYPGKSIGKQRIIVEINDEVFLKYISKTRTNAFGFREKVVGILDNIPSLKKISYNFDKNNVFVFNKKDLINPKEEFFNNRGKYMELMFHSVMDTLGSLGIDIVLNGEKGFKFVGKIITFANSHHDDIEMLKMIQNGNIEVKFL